MPGLLRCARNDGDRSHAAARRASIGTDCDRLMATPGRVMLAHRLQGKRKQAADRSRSDLPVFTSPGVRKSVPRLAVSRHRNPRLGEFHESQDGSQDCAEGIGRGRRPRGGRRVSDAGAVAGRRGAHAAFRAAGQSREFRSDLGDAVRRAQRRRAGVGYALRLRRQAARRSARWWSPRRSRPTG